MAIDPACPSAVEAEEEKDEGGEGGVRRLLLSMQNNNCILQVGQNVACHQGGGK